MPRQIIVELAERLRRLAPVGSADLGALAERGARSRARRELLRLDAEHLGLAPPRLAPVGEGGEPLIARWLAERLEVRPEALGDLLVLRGPLAPHHLLTLAFVNPGDRVLVPDPAPSLFREATLLADAVPIAYLRDVGAAAAGDARDTAGVPARLQFLAPCAAPTGLPDPPAEIEAAVRAALVQSRILAADVSAHLLDLGAAPRMATLVDHPRALDVGVVIVVFDALFGAASSPFAVIAGNRDLVAGARRLVEALGLPVGAPAPRATAQALAGIDHALERARGGLRARRDALVEGLQRLGFRTAGPAAGLSLWVAAPRGYRGLPFARMLLRRAGIFVRPGIHYGESGEAFIAVSLAPPPEVLYRALGRIEELAPRKLRLRRQLTRARRRVSASPTPPSA